MREPRIVLRYITSAVYSIIGYVLLVTLADGFRDFLLHLRHLNLSVLTDIKTNALHGRYLWWSFTRWNYFVGVAQLAVLVFVIWDSIMTYKVADSRRKYKMRHGYASHGTAHWQDKHESKRLYHQDNRGILLGDYEKTEYKPLPEQAFDNPKIGSYSVHPFTSPLNQQYLIFGPPGSLKTTGFILPNIFHLAQQGISGVVTDPKGELYELTAEYMKQQGYEVVVLDYLWFKYGHRQNLLDYIFAEEQYAELASMYLGATRNEGDKRDFFEEKAQELFSALLGFVHQAYGKTGYGNLTEVYRLVPKMLDAAYAISLFREHNIHGAPMEFLRGVLASANSEATLASILSTLSGKLQLFALSNVRAQTAATDYDIRTIADKKTIVYVWISDSQRTYSPIISAFWTVLFNTLYERARQTGGKLPVPVSALMDEMANIGKIADFDTKLTTMRSRGIYPMMVWHSYPQLKLKYGQDYADAIMGACDTKVLLACGDFPTAELFSKMLGDTTIETQSRRGARNIHLETQNATNQFTGRRLLQPNELMSLDRKFAVVLQSGRPPVLLNKVQYKYWDYLIAPKAMTSSLPQYILDDGLTKDEPIAPDTSEGPTMNEQKSKTPVDQQVEHTSKEARSTALDWSR